MKKKKKNTFAMSGHIQLVESKVNLSVVIIFQIAPFNFFPACEVVSLFFIHKLAN